MSGPLIDDRRVEDAVDLAETYWGQDLKCSRFRFHKLPKAPLINHTRKQGEAYPHTCTAGLTEDVLTADTRKLRWIVRHEVGHLLGHDHGTDPAMAAVYRP